MSKNYVYARRNGWGREKMATEFIKTKQKLEIRNAMFEEHCNGLLEEIRRACSNYDEEKARLCFEKLVNVNDVKRILAHALDIFNQKQKIPVYSAGTWFLYDCYQYLMQVRLEVIHYVTGVDYGDIFTLDKMSCFEIGRQSMVYVKGDIVSSQKVLIQMTEYGHKLHGWFHSHPGKGTSATTPSIIDRAHQERLESGSYPAIGAIFTRDGFIRFFSVRRKFEVSLYGEGVEKVDEGIFRLTKIRKVHKR